MYVKKNTGVKIEENSKVAYTLRGNEEKILHYVYTQKTMTFFTKYESLGV